VGVAAPPTSPPALVTDQYELMMLEGYWREGMEGTAVFELSVGRMPPRRAYLVAAGLAQAVEYLLDLRVTGDEIDWLARDGSFAPGFLESLRDLRFTGDVDALPEGTVCFPREPLLRIRAPIREAQLVESRLLDIIHLQTVVASKAVRCVSAAPGRRLIDFGMRRAHGAEATLPAARAAYLAGFTSTATVEAARRFGIPLCATMAQSYVQAHDDEAAAFAAFARAHPEDACLLIDTYDAARGAREVVRLAPALAAEGVPIRAVRIDNGDSGDVGASARRVRVILDEGGLRDTAVIVSGNLDEYRLRDLVVSGAPIDGYGVGTRLDPFVDAPYLDCAYRLQEYDGRPRRTGSQGEGTWPGRTQVLRRHGPDGRWDADVVALEGEAAPGRPLLEPVIRSGRLVAPLPGLDRIRRRVRDEVGALPAWMHTLDGGGPAPVEISPAIRALAAEYDAAAAAGAATMGA